MGERVAQQDRAHGQARHKGAPPELEQAGGFLGGGLGRHGQQREGAVGGARGDGGHRVSLEHVLHGRGRGQRGGVSGGPAVALGAVAKQQTPKQLQGHRPPLSCLVRPVAGAAPLDEEELQRAAKAACMHTHGRCVGRRWQGIEGGAEVSPGQPELKLAIRASLASSGPRSPAAAAARQDEQATERTAQQHSSGLAPMNGMRATPAFETPLGVKRAAMTAAST